MCSQKDISIIGQFAPLGLTIDPIKLTVANLMTWIIICIFQDPQGKPLKYSNYIYVLIPMVVSGGSNMQIGLFLVSDYRFYIVAHRSIFLLPTDRGKRLCVERLAEIILIQTVPSHYTY